MTELPESFIQQMTTLLGADACAELARALDETAPVSIRLNAAKPLDAPTDLPEGVGLGNAPTEPVPWCAAGRYLSARPSFTLDPAFHAGAYYVQEAASMFVEQAYREIVRILSAENGTPTAPTRLLDLCAAPGGKSTLWRSLLPEGSLLVANEPMPQRAHILAENLAKWGAPDVCVTNAWPADFAPLREMFDVIAADVPCSGEGMFRKDEGARTEWSPAAVETCAERARGIIADVWPALRPGGFLVYSTCTFNRAEDEDSVRHIARSLGASVLALPTDAAWGISGDTTAAPGETPLPVCHFFPHKARGEGFFLALLRKDGAPTAAKPKKAKGKRGRELPIEGGRKAAAWLRANEAFKLFRPDAEHICAIRQTLADDAARLSAAVRTLSAGIVVAEEKGRKLVPTQQLALSAQLAPEAFPRVPLTYADAVAYLRREAIVLPAEAPRGYVLVTYAGLPLGFVNNLGSRANNLYPAEWRIRRQSLPNC